ncbi:MAG: hypothetical protein UW83_C0031G0009, partial [Parcubacteria group bacterium GW2011_GWD1_44_9]
TEGVSISILGERLGLEGAGTGGTGDAAICEAMAAREIGPKYPTAGEMPLVACHRAKALLVKGPK